MERTIRGKSGDSAHSRSGFDNGPVGVRRYEMRGVLALAIADPGRKRTSTSADGLVKVAQNNGHTGDLADFKTDVEPVAFCRTNRCLLAMRDGKR